MDREELERCLFVSRGHSAAVDVIEWSEAPGYVRIITIHRGGAVSIEFQRAREFIEDDSEGAGLKYVAQYDDMDLMLRDLEEYLGRPLMEWRTFPVGSYTPLVVDEPDPSINQKYFEDAVRFGQIPLPCLARYQVAGVYWRHVAKYGKYCPDKLFEEQESELGSEETE